MVGVVVGYGLVVGVSVVAAGPPGASADGSGGPVTTGLSWLVWTLGTGYHYHRLLVVPGAVVVTAHAGMLSPLGQNLLGTPGKRRLQERAEADPAHPERTKLRGVGLVGQRDRIDGQW